MSIVLPPSTALPSRATRAAGVALALALGLSGCGAGLRAQTYQERTTSDSTNEAIGALAIRHIRVLPPTGAETYQVGSDARVGLVVVNEGAEADRLTTVTSDAAARVEVLGPNGQPATLTSQPNTATSGFVLVLRGLTRELRPGQYVQMELTFAENGSETMLVPVEVTGTPGPQREGYEIGETDSNGDVVIHEEEGEGEPGEGAEGEGTEGEGTEGEGAEGEGTEGEGTEGEGTEGEGAEGEGTEGEGTEGQGTEGDSAEGEGVENEGVEGGGAEGAEGAEGGSATQPPVG